MNKTSAEYIGWLLATNDRAVERAILVLYSRQTADEQVAQDTKHCNGRGFSASEARKGSYMAKWLLGGNRLTGQWMMDARKIAFNHIGQLVEEATLKMERESMKEKEEQEAILLRIEREVAEEQAIIQSEAEGECR